MDFINYSLILLLIAGSIMYFIVPGNFERFQELINNLAPLVYFIFILLVKIKLSRIEHAEKQERQEGEIKLRLNTAHKIFYELATIMLPIMMLFISVFMGASGYVDAILAIVAYFVMWLSGKIIFSKKNQI